MTWTYPERVLEVCRDRNFRISPGPAQGPFGSSPKFIFKYVNRTPPKPNFLLFQPEWSPIYYLPWLIDVYFDAQMPVILERII
jgi:hypothetical protein